MSRSSFSTYKRKSDTIIFMTTDIIKKRLKVISDLQAEMNKVKEIFNEYLEEDNSYQDVLEEVNKVKSQLNEKKAKTLLAPKFKEIEDKLKDIRQTMKENKELLSQEVVEYYRESGEMEIEDNNGDKKRAVFSVKLINS